MTNVDIYNAAKNTASLPKPFYYFLQVFGKSVIFTQDNESYLIKQLGNTNYLTDKNLLN